MESKPSFAWAAGATDGEGCFHINEHRYNTAGILYSYWRPQLCMGQNSKTGVPAILERMQYLFGGTINGPYNCRGKKVRYMWQIGGFELVQTAFAAMWQWLGPVKREQGKRVLQTHLERDTAWTKPRIAHRFKHRPWTEAEKSAISLRMMGNKNAISRR